MLLNREYEANCLTALCWFRFNTVNWCKIAIIRLIEVSIPRQIDSKKLGSNLSQLRPENRVKPGCLTQSQAKRINEIAFRWLFRDQGVGGSNPLSPVNHIPPFISGTCRHTALLFNQDLRSRAESSSTRGSLIAAT
jgi:hypothetical protein